MMENRQEIGWVLDVTTSQLGSALSAPVTSGDTIMLVDDAVDFDEGGGVGQINGVLFGYSKADPVTDTLTLVAPAAFTAEIDDFAVAWDEANGMAMVEYRALVECMSALTDDDPITATLQHGLSVMLPTGPRDGRGESVLMEQHGGMWRVVDVLGKDSVLEVMYGDPDGRHLSLGMEGITGVTTEVVEGETVQVETFRYDVDTGNLTILGEFGTAPPGEVGIFAFSTRFSHAGTQVTQPTLQFNVGIGRVQPRIIGDTSAGSGLWMYSGASTNEREALVAVDNGRFYAMVEKDPGVGVGAWMQLTRTDFMVYPSEGDSTLSAFVVGDDMLLRSKPRHGANNYAGQVSTQPGGSGFDPSMQVGMRSEVTGNFQGMRVNLGTSVRMSTAGPLEVTSGDGSAWRPVHALDLIPQSDIATKTNIVESPINALEVVRGAPVYEWEYIDDPGNRRIGPMANDLPDFLVQSLGDDAPSPGSGTLGLSVVQQVAVVWQAVQELADEVDAMRAATAPTP